MAGKSYSQHQMRNRHKDSLVAWLRAFWASGRPRLRTAWHVLKQAYLRFLGARATEAAAGMAYYAIFSLFPLLIFLVVFGSSVLKGAYVREQVIRMVTQVLPTSQEVVVENLNSVLETRKTVGSLAALSLLWSSSGFFSILAHQINRAWPRALLRTSLERRIVALAMVGGLAGLLILWFGFTTTLLPHLGVPLWRALLRDAPILRRILRLAVAWLPPFLFSFGLYRFLPKTHVRWQEAFWGALLTTAGWKVVTTAFLWYLSSGWAKYHLVYGSLASVLILMLWIYLISAIILFGAHLSAAAARHEGGEDVAPTPAGQPPARR